MSSVKMFLMAWRKCSRKIVVNDISYRWAIRKKPTYSQAGFTDIKMTVAVELFDEPGKVLLITFPWYRPDNWIEPSKAKVTPKIIQQCIAKAIQNGWQPEICGSAVELEYDENDS